MQFMLLGQALMDAGHEQEGESSEAREQREHIAEAKPRQRPQLKAPLQFVTCSGWQALSDTRMTPGRR